MNRLRFFKLLSQPINFIENSIYVIKTDTNHYELFITDNNGNLMRLNANKLQGYEPSFIPNPNSIVLSDVNGKINYERLPNINNSYGRLRVGTSFPTTDLKENDLFYRTTDNRLFIRKDKNWFEIDWKQMVQSSPEWNSRLRIQNNQLQISPDGTNWYNCIPCIGCDVIELMNIDNTNYSQLYWINVGTTIIIKNGNHIPIVYAKDIEPAFSGMFYNITAFENWVGLRPSNITISNGLGQFVSGNNTTTSAGRATNLSIFPLIEQSNTTENWGTFWFQIRNNQRFLGNSITQGFGGNVIMTSMTSGTAPTLSYWLGTWFRQDNLQLTMSRITLTRIA